MSEAAHTACKTEHEHDQRHDRLLRAVAAHVLSLLAENVAQVFQTISQSSCRAAT